MKRSRFRENAAIVEEPAKVTEAVYTVEYLDADGKVVRTAEEVRPYNRHARVEILGHTVSSTTAAPAVRVSVTYS